VRKTVYGVRRVANGPHNVTPTIAVGAWWAVGKTSVNAPASAPTRQRHTHADSATERLTRRRPSVHATRAPRTITTMIAGTLVAVVSCWSLFVAAAAKHGSNARSAHSDGDVVRRYTASSAGGEQHCCTGQSSSTADVVVADDTANLGEVNKSPSVRSKARYAGLAYGTRVFRFTLLLFKSVSADDGLRYSCRQCVWFYTGRVTCRV